MRSSTISESETAQCSNGTWNDVGMEKEIASNIEKMLSDNRRKPETLINSLQKVQDSLGYLPKDVQEKVAEIVGIPPNVVYGVVSFYNLFTMVPKGKHTVTVCQGTSCYVRGGKRLLENLKDTLKIDVGDTTKDGNFSLSVVRCLGACALSPVVTVDKDLYKHLTIAKLPAVLSRYSKQKAGEE